MKQLLCLLCIMPLLSSAQNDFLILKKKNRPMHYYYTGTSIEFVTGNGAYRNGLITAIKNDSIHLQEFYVVKRPTTLGTIFLDTVGSFSYAYHYKAIASFGAKKRRNFNLQGSGAALMSGGILLILGSGIQWIADKDKFSPALLGGAAALTGVGYLLNMAAARPITIGKKYQLDYMRIK